MPQALVRKMKGKFQITFARHTRRSKAELRIRAVVRGFASHPAKISAASLRGRYRVLIRRDGLIEQVVELLMFQVIC